MKQAQGKAGISRMKGIEEMRDYERWLEGGKKDPLVKPELSFTVEENLIFIKVGKQRNGLPSGRTWMCRIDFDRNEIAPIVK